LWFLLANAFYVSFLLFLYIVKIEKAKPKNSISSSWKPTNGKKGVVSQPATQGT